MSGIVFYATEDHDAVVGFYRERLGMDVWLDQPDCTILRHGNLLVGFCDRDRTDDCGIVTFVYSDRAGVDAAHDRLGEAADEEPHENERYDIYQFFATDPDGRTVECQAFLNEDVELP
ncbi:MULTISPECIES: VOC family protein [Haloferacaceae]|uniref:VOC family protein n=1 Tax=Halorubrum glutamatedens TaxID=2707018 RepID=A0ABD5QLK9_9EURY|nr:VOC family protein [Halobellus captivus]